MVLLLRLTLEVPPEVPRTAPALVNFTSPAVVATTVLLARSCRLVRTLSAAVTSPLYVNDGCTPRPDALLAVIDKPLATVLAIAAEVMALVFTDTLELPMLLNPASTAP